MRRKRLILLLLVVTLLMPGRVSAQAGPTAWELFVQAIKYMQAYVWGEKVDTGSESVCRVMIFIPKWMFASTDDAVARFVNNLFTFISFSGFKNLQKGTINDGNFYYTFDRDEEDCHKLNPPPAQMPSGDRPPKVDWDGTPYASIENKARRMAVLDRLDQVMTAPLGSLGSIGSWALPLALACLLVFGVCVIARQRRHVMAG